jgi:hypothetical protein
MKYMGLNQLRMCSSIRGPISKTLIAIVAALQLVACGGGGGGSSASGSGTGTLTPSGTTTTAGTGTPTSGGTTTTAGTGTQISGGTTTSSGSGSQSTANATGSLALSWVAPVARADGTPLSLADIDGFRIYYGSTAGNYSHSVNITDATTQQVVLKNLASGTWYIVMTTYDVDGRESGYSVAVKKTVS